MPCKTKRSTRLSGPRRYAASVWFAALCAVSLISWAGAPIAPATDARARAEGASAQATLHAGPLDDTLDYLYDLLSWLLGEEPEEPE